MEESQPQIVYNVDHLRYLVGQAQPGKRLFVEIAPNLSFHDTRMLWEAASLDGEADGVHTLFNQEMLCTKMEDADFIDPKIRELKHSRDYLNGRIGCMQSWFNMMEREVEDGGPHISARHEALLMFGPRMYLDLNQIGTMNLEEFKEHRQEILDEYLHLRVPAGRTELEYYKQPAAQWREFQDQRSLKKINMTFLKIKIECLVLLRDCISVGIKFLEKLSTARIHMGCGDANLGSFRDIGIGDDMDLDD